MVNKRYPTPLSKVNFEWLEKLSKIRQQKTNGKLTGSELYRSIINVFLKDHINYKPNITEKDIKNALKMGKIKVIKKEHPGWLEWQRLKYPKNSKKNVFKSDFAGLLSKNYLGPFGRYSYTYSSEKGIISLIKLNNYMLDGKDVWEIYAYENVHLFEDVKRFDSKAEAEIEIMRLLG
jgi:hypothetical protein